MKKEKRQLKKEIKKTLKEVQDLGFSWWDYGEYIDQLKEKATKQQLKKELKQLETL